MSSLITQELAASGVAPVIAVLADADAHPEAASVADVATHFVESPFSQGAALARAGDRDRPVGASLPPVLHFAHLGVVYGTVDRAGLSALRRSPDVTAVSGAPPLSIIRPVHAAATRLTTPVTWGIEALGVPELWAEGVTGEGVLIGHLDTGVDARHPALVGAVAHFAVIDDLGRVTRPATEAHDTADHGTHTAATLAGRAVNGRSVGVAPDAQLASAVVIEGGDAVARVLGGMDWIVGLRARVLSMSLGFRGWWDDFLPLTQRLRVLGVLPVFAVGNEGPGTSRSPGNYAQVVSVGAVDKAGRVPAWSSSRRFRRRRDQLVPDLVAPGVRVVSARPGSGWQHMDGTSMAVPHVAGLAALLWSAAPAATVDAVEGAILGSCTRAAPSPEERANRDCPVHRGRWPPSGPASFRRHRRNIWTG